MSAIPAFRKKFFNLQPTFCTLSFSLSLHKNLCPFIDGREIFFVLAMKVQNYLLSLIAGTKNSLSLLKKNLKQFNSESKLKNCCYLLLSHYYKKQPSVTLIYCSKQKSYSDGVFACLELCGFWSLDTLCVSRDKKHTARGTLPAQENCPLPYTFVSLNKFASRLLFS